MSKYRENDLSRFQEYCDSEDQKQWDFKARESLYLTINALDNLVFELEKRVRELELTR